MTDHYPIGVNLPKADIADGKFDDIDDDYEAWKAFLAEEDEPQPGMATTGLAGGGIAFSTRGYATSEEADAAQEAWLREVLGVSDEEE